MNKSALNKPNETARDRPDHLTATDNRENPVLDLQIQHLLVAVEHELRCSPEGLTELALIKRLQNNPWQLIGPVEFAEPAQLYPVHFLLFHTLYRLRDQLAGQGETVSISPLNLQLRACAVVSGVGVAGEVDKLRMFYLDLSQYQLSDDYIREMMDDFWNGHQRQPPLREEASEAAAALGFEQLPEDFSTVKQRFRRAVMDAHPDRGGDTESIQSLNQAFAVLKAHFH
ncbi:DNA-J related domain-containing protein [Marinobacter sp.]|uniref:DNA-J related domain-containing protein n=1 Tax=Marinobacter sp. TaxID=50741 RepID=UPI0034A4D8B2